MCSIASSSSLRPLRRALVAALALGLGACTPFALSPPARTLPLESAATLDEGDVAVQASATYHDSLGSEGGGASVRARVGLVPQLEAQAEATYAYVDYDDERSPHLGAGRLGLKLAIVEHLAVVAGFGAGSHAHGAFIAPDAGLIVGYENPYVVPWIALRGWVSVPVDAQSVTVTQDDGGDGMPDVFVLVPPNTAGWQLSTGVRIPVSIDTERGLGMNVLVGGGYARLHGLDGQNEHGFWQLEGGLELVVDP
jgi:hypothetical protein